jgi:hypothetical protein
LEVRDVSDDTAVTFTDVAVVVDFFVAAEDVDLVASSSSSSLWSFLKSIVESDNLLKVSIIVFCLGA